MMMLCRALATALLVGISLYHAEAAVPKCNLMTSGPGLYHVWVPYGNETWRGINDDGKFSHKWLKKATRNGKNAFWVFEDFQQTQFSFDITSDCKFIIRWADQLYPKKHVWPKIYAQSIGNHRFPNPYCGEVREGGSHAIIPRPASGSSHWDGCLSAVLKFDHKGKKPTAVESIESYTNQWRCMVYYGTGARVHKTPGADNQSDHWRSVFLNELPEYASTDERIFVADGVGSLDECERKAKAIAPKVEAVTLSTTGGKCSYSSTQGKDITTDEYTYRHVGYQGVKGTDFSEYTCEYTPPGEKKI